VVIVVFLICIIVMSLPMSSVPRQRRDARHQSILHMFSASPSSQTLNDGRNELPKLSKSYVRGSPHGIPHVEEFMIGY
jgi:hypothetical protein